MINLINFRSLFCFNISFSETFFLFSCSLLKNCFCPEGSKYEFMDRGGPHCHSHGEAMEAALSNIRSGVDTLKVSVLKLGNI